MAHLLLPLTRLCRYSPNGDRATEAHNETRLTLEEIASQFDLSTKIPSSFAN